jgi:hypothetical protein
MFHDSVFHVSGCVLLVAVFKAPAMLVCVFYCRTVVNSVNTGV